MWVVFSLFGITHSKLNQFHLVNRAAMGRARFLFCTGFIINRAAMGRARFLLCTGFINRAAMGRARFLLYTGFIIIFIFLTARPWAERGSCSARDFFFFVFLSVTRPKPPLGQITFGTESRNLGCLLAKCCWNNDVREMLRILCS